MGSGDLKSGATASGESPKSSGKGVVPARVSRNTRALSLVEKVNPLRVLIVTAPWYADIAALQIEGAERALAAGGAQFEHIEVPGALEIPAAIAIAARATDDGGKSLRYDGFVALGCVIRGETTHYDIVSRQSAAGLMDLSIRAMLAIGNGILTVENRKQAFVRARPDAQDKGGGAATACLAMIGLRRKFLAGVL